jgi:hypothetical protein
MNPTSCLFGLWFVKNPFFLLAGALLFDEKIRQRTALFLFGFFCGMLEYSLTSRNPKNNCCHSRIFGAQFGGKDRGFCTYKL